MRASSCSLLICGSGARIDPGWLQYWASEVFFTTFCYEANRYFTNVLRLQEKTKPVVMVVGGASLCHRLVHIPGQISFTHNCFN